MDIFRKNVVLIVRHYTISLRYLGTKKVYVKVVLFLDLFSSRTFFIYIFELDCYTWRAVYIFLVVFVFNMTRTNIYMIWLPNFIRVLSLFFSLYFCYKLNVLQSHVVFL